MYLTERWWDVIKVNVCFSLLSVRLFLSWSRWDYYGGPSPCTQPLWGGRAPNLQLCRASSRPAAAPTAPPWSCCRTLCPDPDACLWSPVQVSPLSPGSLITAQRVWGCTLALTGDPCSMQSLSAVPSPGSGTGPGTLWGGRSSPPTSPTVHTRSCSGGRTAGGYTGWSLKMWMLFTQRPDRKDSLSSTAAPTGEKNVTCHMNPI